MWRKRKGSNRRNMSLDEDDMPCTGGNTSYVEGKQKSRNDGKFSRKNSNQRHPPHLKGKEIGLWYARKNKNKAQQEEENYPMLMDKHQERKIQALLDDIAHNDLPDLPQTGCSTKTSSTSLNSGNVSARSCDGDSTCTDEAMFAKHSQKIHNKQYAELKKFREKLPSFALKKEILDMVESNSVVVISGETGCGKTTQVPQFILDHYIEERKGSKCTIFCTQPRRISAIGVAERVAQERNESCGGESVGYQIRLESKLPRSRGSILFCTTGVLIKFLTSDKLLSRASHIIVDEVHERDVLSDFLLIMLRDIVKIRPDLKIILMSATLNSEMFSRYFNNCPRLHIPGFTFPVKAYFLEDVLEQTSYEILPPVRSKKFKRQNKPKEDGEDIDAFYRSLVGNYSSGVIRSLKNVDQDEIDLQLLSALIKYICIKKPIGQGAILVFLPGWTNISEMNKILTDQTYFKSGNHLIIPLHSLMPTVNQREVFNRPPAGVWKIILATNIAETSITIDDVVYVIDCGKIKMKNFDTENNIATLKPEWVSRANAMQRKGRAGRVQAGICYHLYMRYQWDMLDMYQLPEMLRTRLEELCLQIKILELGEIVSFLSKALEPPSIEAVRLSVSFLQTLNALDDDEELTPLGYHLAQLPVDPQAGKMILLGAIFSCLDPVATVAASIGFKDAFLVPLGKEQVADAKRQEFAGKHESDHITLINAFDGWERAKRKRQEHNFCWQNFLSSSTLQMLSNMKSQFASLLKDLNFIHVADPKHFAANLNSGNVRLIKAVICAGLHPNIAKLKSVHRKNPQNSKAITKDGKMASLFPSSVINYTPDVSSPWIVYHKKWKSTSIFVQDATVVTPFALLLFCGKLVVQEKDRYNHVVSIDNWIKYSCSASQSNRFKELRALLDKLLERRIKYPNPAPWQSHNAEGCLLRGILELLHTENKS